MAMASRTALITGSGRNIGRGCALRLAEAGFNIIVNGSQDREACEEVAREVRKIGTNATVSMADIGDKVAVDRMTEDALTEYERIDVLINNAAIRPGTAFLEMTDADLTKVMTVNTYAGVWLARAFLPGMIEAGWGRIVNFTGMNAQRGTGGRPSVTMSKHAMWGLTKALAKEFGPKGVTSNIISPGTFPADDADLENDARWIAMRDSTPVGRLGHADDIAALVAYLCGDNGGFTNGQLLQVNGGVEI